jgi:hypothetical protein
VRQIAETCVFAPLERQILPAGRRKSRVPRGPVCEQRINYLKLFGFS